MYTSNKLGAWFYCNSQIMFTRKQQRIRSQQRHPLEGEQLEQRCEQADEWRRTIAIEPCKMNCSIGTPFLTLTEP